MSRKWLLIAVLIAVVSCKHKAAETGNHLPAKTMQSVLLDVSLAEAYSILVKDSTHKGGTKNLDSLAVYYSMIFNHYKITPEAFGESLEWYKANPDKLDTMYTAMLNKVTVWQNKTTPAAPAPKINPIPLPLPPNYKRVPHHNL